MLLNFEVNVLYIVDDLLHCLCLFFCFVLCLNLVFFENEESEVKTFLRMHEGVRFFLLSFLCFDLKGRGVPCFLYEMTDDLRRLL